MSTNTVVSIVAFVAIWVAIIATKSCMLEQKKSATTGSMAAHVNDSTTHWRDQYNTEHGQRLAAEGKYDEVMNSYAGDMDEAASRLQIKDRQIDGLQSLVATMKGNFHAIIDTVHDSLIFAYRDSSIQETGTIHGDTLDVNYLVSVPIHLTQYWKRAWLLGRKTHYVDGYSGNPSAHITGLESVRIEATEPGRFGLGPYIGVSLNGRPSLGIALTYSLIRF